jgi:hypothetical protein
VLKHPVRPTLLLARFYPMKVATSMKNIELQRYVQTDIKFFEIFFF